MLFYILSRFRTHQRILYVKMMTGQLDVDVMLSVWISTSPVTYHRLQVSLKLSPPTQKPERASNNADKNCRLMIYCLLFLVISMTIRGATILSQNIPISVFHSRLHQLKINWMGAIINV